MTLTPTEAHEQLDKQGLLDDAHGPGCYQLRVAAPDSVETAHQRWLADHGVTPGGNSLEQIATGDDVCYVGASQDVYGRIADHTEAEVRQSSFLQTFPPTEVVAVKPVSDPFRHERSMALRLARDGWAVIMDGEVFSR